MIKTLFFLSIFEFIIYILFSLLKKNFKWLVALSDANPTFSKSAVKKYNTFTYNKNTGWDNKKINKITEIIYKKKKILFEYNFDKSNGSRLTGNSFKKIKNIFFGDSYALCRCSQDSETIQHFLEKKIKSKILNYGVGNYGLDQVLLKIKKTKLSKAKNIIILFVPETIARVHSYWKHFLEFGNIFGFKPKFSIIDNKLKLENNHVKKIKINKVQSIINNLKYKDIFYKEKFLKNVFRFPFTLFFLKNFLKNLMIFFYLILEKITLDKKFYELAFGVIVKNNIEESQKMYKNGHYSFLLEKIILEINHYLKKKNKNVFFLIVPQLLDIKINHKINSSEIFYKNISKKYGLKVYDLTKDIKKQKNISQLYFDDFYGGHLNNVGNKLISALIYKKIGNAL